MNRGLFRSLSLFFFIALALPPANASTTVKGTFTAEQACAAYVSKNKLTNPDNTHLVANTKYTIFETNRSNQPDWFRIRIDSANPPERWVAKYCGAAALSGGSVPEPVNDCHTPGLQDSYVLALSWQPAFCETHRDKPECRIDDTRAYQARNFTLHGLWPNKASCGTSYGYCGELRDQPAEFCDYPALSLFSATRSDLEQVMPSAAAGSCLQRHEWYKHGTCQTSWSVDGYFDLAIDLTRQFNESGVAYFIARNIGNTVHEADFIAKIDCAQGANTHRHIELKCQNGNLVDVYINLPDAISPGTALGDLLQASAGEFKSNCGGQFKVDAIGFNH